MESDVKRDSVASFLTDVAAALLAVYVLLLLLRATLDLSLPLDYEIFAIIIAGSFLLLGATGTLRRTLCMQSSTLTSRQFLLLLIGLAVAGGVLRVYGLGAQSFWFDEAITTNAAIGLLETGRPQFASGQPYYRGIPHTVLVAISIGIFGISEWAARLPAVLLGVATIPATYWLGREVGNRRVGLFAAIIVTFLTWEIAWGRQARMYQQLQFCYVLALIGLARIDRTGLDDRSAVALIAIGTLGAALTHTIGLILFPVVAVFVSLHLILIRRGLPAHAWLVAGGGILAAVALEFLGYGPIGVTRTVLSTDIVHFERYHAWVSTEFGPLYYLAIIGFGLSFRRRWHGFLLALAVLPPLWVLAFNTRLFAGRYLYFAVPVAAIYVGLVVDLVVEQFRRHWTEVSPKRFGNMSRRDGVASALTFMIPLIVVLIIVASSLTFVPQAAYSLGPNAPQPDFKSAYAHVDAASQSDDVLVAGWTAPAAYYHGTADYWLVHNLTGAERDWTIDGEYEVYSGARPVSNAAEFRDTIDRHDRGWVVVDRIVKQRLGPAEREILANLTAHELDADGMYVYSWEQPTSANETAGDLEGTNRHELYQLVAKNHPSRTMQRGG